MDSLTAAAEIIPNPECHLRSRKAILIERADWEIIKKSLYGTCISQDCKQSLDLISSYFEMADMAVGKLHL